MYNVPETRVTRLALERHYTAALDQGGILVALCRCALTDREPLYALADRQRVQLVDIIHDFCYNARKAIELAEFYTPGTIAHAKAIELRGFGETEVTLDIMDAAKPLASQSLWWALGRVIHSRDLTIHDQEDPRVGTEWARAPNITIYWTPIAAAVRSDYDGPDERHWMITERLVELFLALGDKFRSALAAARAEGGC